MAKYIRRSSKGETRVLSAKERNAEDSDSARGWMALVVCAIFTFIAYSFFGVATPLAKAGVIAVGVASLVLGAALYEYILALVGLAVLFWIGKAVWEWIFTASGH
jgi:hypothetical protein